MKAPLVRSPPPKADTAHSWRDYSVPKQLGPNDGAKPMANHIRKPKPEISPRECVNGAIQTNCLNLKRSPNLVVQRHCQKLILSISDGCLAVWCRPKSSSKERPKSGGYLQNCYLIVNRYQSTAHTAGRSAI